jgi:hypothetical protein
MISPASTATTRPFRFHAWARTASWTVRARATVEPGDHQVLRGALEGGERLRQAGPVGGVLRPGDPLVPVDSYQAVPVGLAPPADLLVLDVETEPLLGLAVGRDPEICDGVGHGSDLSARRCYTW